MRHTSVDQRDELVLRFEFSVEDVARHVYYLKKFHPLIAFFIIFNFELDVLALYAVSRA